MSQHILRIDASARTTGSVTRALTDQVVDQLSTDSTTITARDLNHALPQIDESWVTANFTAADERSDAQRAILAQSDALVAEIEAADTLVIGAPIYNFSVPAALKIWIDLIARAGRTFRYTSEGPKGLLEGKRAVIVIASGGTKIGSEIDFASGYLRHVLGFVGITDLHFVTADQQMVDADAAHDNAQNGIAALAA